MIWNLEKLEQERLDLIEVIDNLKRWERFSIDDRHIISLQITAHMMRLSELMRTWHACAMKNGALRRVLPPARPCHE